MSKKYKPKPWMKGCSMMVQHAKRHIGMKRCARCHRYEDECKCKQ